MTNKQKKQAILEKIREVCDLKRLEFGCEVKLDGLKEIMIDSYNYYGGGGYNGEDYDDDEIISLHELENWGANIEIIGLPVELNHLLLALGKVEKMISIDMHAMVILINKTIYTYDLRISVEQNLEQNEALTDLIYELIV